MSLVFLLFVCIPPKSNNLFFLLFVCIPPKSNNFLFYFFPNNWYQSIGFKAYGV